MRVFIAAAGPNERTRLTKAFQEHLWTVDAPEDFSEEYDTVLDDGYDAVVGSLAPHFSERDGLIIAEDVGNFDVFSAQFAQAHGHQTSHIGILTATQGEHTLSLDMLDMRNLATHVKTSRLAARLAEPDLAITVDEKKHLRSLSNGGAPQRQSHRKALQHFLNAPDALHSRTKLAKVMNITEEYVGIALRTLAENITSAEHVFSFKADGHGNHYLVNQARAHEPDLKELNSSAFVRLFRADGSSEMIDLTPAERSLLLQFMAEPNVVHSNSKLAARAEITEGGVHVTVSHIREKIAPFGIKGDHLGTRYFTNDSRTDTILAQAHGIKVHKNRTVTYNNGTKDIPLSFAKGRDFLIDLLKGGRPETIIGSNKTFMSHVRQVLAAASACDDAPHGYDFFKADSSRYQLRETPVALKPKLEPEGMLFTLGDGRLVVNTHAKTMKNKDTGAECSLSLQQARFLEAIVLHQGTYALTISILQDSHYLTNATVVFSVLCGKINKDLGLSSQLYLEPGTTSHPGYKAINVNMLSDEPEMDGAHDDDTPDVLAPAAE